MSSQVIQEDSKFLYEYLWLGSFQEATVMRFENTFLTSDLKIHCQSFRNPISCRWPVVVSVSSQRFLGLWFDTDLPFETHVDEVCSRFRTGIATNTGLCWLQQVGLLLNGTFGHQINDSLLQCIALPSEWAYSEIAEEDGATCHKQPIRRELSSVIRTTESTPFLRSLCVESGDVRAS